MAATPVDVTLECEYRMMSVSTNHVVLALSFSSAFFVCYLGSQLLISTLNDAGYDLFGTILGLQKQPNDMSSQLVKDFSNNQLAQLVAIALAVVSSVLFFSKFTKSTLFLVNVCVETDTLLQSRRSQYWIRRIGRNSRS